MKISGFTIARNVIKFNYPIVESIRSILPICDEFVVNVGDSQDDTLSLIKSIKTDKIRIVQTKWDFSEGKEVLSRQTNVALKECKGDWAFYLQSDEVIHESDLPYLRWLMEKHLHDQSVDAFRFRWLHFYGSYFRYRVDYGWYQKQDRIIRNNGQIESFGDAFGFQRKDGQPLKHKHTRKLLYHYGWVHPEDMMMQRVINAAEIGFASLQDHKGNNGHNGEHWYGDLDRFPIYFGTHPQVMLARIHTHQPSQDDYRHIRRCHWWNPLHLMKVRFKTGNRVDHKL